MYVILEGCLALVAGLFSDHLQADCPSSQRIQRIEDRLEEMTHLLQYLLHHTVGD